MSSGAADHEDQQPGEPPGETDPIEPVAESAVPGWDIEADVVVVGLGCAGASAAIEAAEAGAEVVVLEAAAMGGGTSAMSGGIIYLGGGTPIQQACGFDDTPEAMEAFLTKACGPDVDADKVSQFCRDSVGQALLRCWTGSRDAARIL